MNRNSKVVFFGWMLILGHHAIAEPDLLDMKDCNNILGMESGKIPDADITASSSFDAANLGPHRARLKHDQKGGAWCPKSIMSPNVTEYLEINLRTVHSITAIQTQGRFGNGQGVEFSELYWIEYWRPGFQKWVVWRNRTDYKLLQGNKNTMDILENKLEPFVLAEKIRIFPFSTHSRVSCMRVELIGCIWTLGLVSYSMHQGIVRGADVNLTDRTYDGFFENGRLYGGLGQLTDGQKGEDNFKDDPNKCGKGYEWVGWRNDSVGLSSHVEILFEFSHVRNFTSMLIHTNNMYSKDVQVFSHVKVFFSIGGVHFNGEPVDFAYMPDTVLQVARYVTVKLHNRVGRFLRLHLYFASRWIMISEVNFDSKLAMGNFSEEGYEVTLKQQGIGHSTQSTKSWGDPFMRDEVPTTHKGIVRDVDNENPTKKGMGSLRPDLNKKEETFGSASEYLVVGILSSVAAILLAAIIFVSIKSRATPPLGQTPHNILPGPIMRGITGLKQDDDKEEVTYHEPYQVMAYQPPTPQRPNRRYGNNLAQVTVHQYFATSQRPNEREPERPPPPPFLLPLPDLGLPGLNLPTHIYDSPVFPSRLSIGPEQFYECINSPDPAPPTVPLITAQTIKKLEDDFKYFEDDMTTVVDLVAFPWKSLKVLHPIGEGQFGTVFMCEVVGKPARSQVIKGDLVAVQTLRMDCTQAAGRNFDQHIMKLGRLKHTNVGRVLGCCREDDKPYGLVLEHLYAGDLNEFLQNRAPDANSNSRQPGMTLGIGCLIYMAAQIASGMKYLEAINFVHKDLSTRNCLVGNSYLVKVGNIGVGKLRYPQDYYVVERRSGPPLPMPIRWMSWESVFMDKFTSRSDSWAFGVTLWEMLTYGRIQPYQELSNMMVMENLKQLCHSSAEQIMLCNPMNCPRDIYELMSDCWKKSETARPSFREIHEFLQAKSISFRSNDE